MVHSEYSRLDISKFEEASRYKFMMGMVIPRPVALVKSLSRDGVLIAAPFSQFVVISVTRRIAEPPGHFEYRPDKTVEFGNRGSGTHLVVGEVTAVHCADGVVSGHRVSHQAINALGRIAGRGYCRTGARFDV
jgi:flavin reductase (DIM6/NTAB) family NADH-FMN oxidoreductase RutF